MKIAYSEPVKSDARQRRRASRLTRHQPTRLHFDGQQYDCTLTDLSSSGARITLSPDVRPPKQFELDVGLAGIVPVVQVWRRGNQMGVRRVKESGQAEAPGRSWFARLTSRTPA